MGWLGFVVAVIGAYLIGSVPTGYLLVKRVKRIDVRTVGSGNVGATNVARAAGTAAGIVVLGLDLGKGLLAVWGLAPWLIHPVTPAAQLACGLAAVVGHTGSVFLKLRGGKGVATTIGVLAGVSPLIAAICLGVWAIVFFVWRYVSLASLAAAVMLPLAQMLMHRARAEILVGVTLALLIIVRHHANITRLVQGTEHRFAGSRARDSRARDS